MDLTVELLTNNEDLVKFLYVDNPMKLNVDISTICGSDTDLIAKFYNKYSDWISSNTISSTSLTPNKHIDYDIERIDDCKYVSLVEPITKCDFIPDLNKLKDYINSATFSVFSRFDLESNQEDKFKFAQDAYDYFVESRDSFPCIPLFSKSKPDNIVSKFLNNEIKKGNYKIALFTTENFIKEDKTFFTFWSFTDTIMFDKVTEKTLKLYFRC